MRRCGAGGGFFLRLGELVAAATAAGALSIFILGSRQLDSVSLGNSTRNATSPSRAWNGETNHPLPKAFHGVHLSNGVSGGCATVCCSARECPPCNAACLLLRSVAGSGPDLRPQPGARRLHVMEKGSAEARWPCGRGGRRSAGVGVHGCRRGCLGPWEGFRARCGAVRWRREFGQGMKRFRRRRRRREEEDRAGVEDNLDSSGCAGRNPSP